MPDDALNPMANDAGWPHIATDLRAENAKLCAKIDAAIKVLSDTRLPAASRINDARSILAH